MLRPTLLPLALALALASASARAQQQSESPCTVPDSLIVRGNERVPLATIQGDIGISRGDTLNFRVLQRAIRNLFATGQFSDVQSTCAVDRSTGRATVIFTVKERPILGSYSVKGTNVVSEGSVKDKISLDPGQPLDPAALTASIQRIDSLYESKGYYLARVRPETTVVNDTTHITFDIEEGRRLAISGVDIEGDKQVGEGTIVDAMKTKPEGFWFWRKGEFDEDKFTADLGERIPKVYHEKGFIDFQVTRDTMLVDRETGKAMLRIGVREGEKYRVGTFDVIGNRHFPTDAIERYFPFRQTSPSITDRVKGLFGGGSDNGENVFDQEKWETATQSLQTAYANEGYIYAQIRPVVERTISPVDSTPVVNLRWEIDEKTPATINRIDIAGNDYTSETCIRDALVILPGDVFSQDRLIRSYQNIQNLGFFESPLPPPDTRPANDKGDVDVIFHLKEKRTGSVNFGASVGEGTGVGGFIGLDQPNLFGRCKRASLQWQFGRYINDFQLSYTDPAIRMSRTTGTVTAYHTQSRYIIADLGRSTSTGGSLQFGFPVFNSYFTRLFVSYGAEAAKFSGGIANRDTTIDTNNRFRSMLGTTITHDNRIDMPFASAGSMQTFTAQFNGGPLGGSTNFQRYTAEMRNYSTLAQFGGGEPGSAPMKLVFGLTARAGALFGDAGPFFFSQKFAMGGTQYGEQLRGYDEFSITPQGYVPETNQNASLGSFGNAFFSATAELGVRFNQMLYADLFYDAGNVYSNPRDFDPTRLFRGAGIGVAIVTPLGPLGLDWAYGFDRVDELGRKDPKWQLHFKLGQLF
ncbi:MAG TPA: outer membrane protein assembly factor BamA [Gemmatimonadaceae bacterium]|nr:outer membrane protein assembly factor BamA [Gemmatimonadaceae bacterium]